MGKQSTKEGQSERLHMRISPEEIEAIDDWRFANRVGSRSDAVRRLCAIGIEFSRNREKTAKIAERVLDHLGTPEGEVDHAAMRKDVTDFFNQVALNLFVTTARYYRDDAFDDLAEKAAARKEDDA